jgi:transposase
MDLSLFEVGKRRDGLGGASYQTSSMVGILMYGYMQGVLSSRVIERKCFEDVGFRVVTQGAFPDHTTICRFRSNHGEAFQAVFTQVLKLCHVAGLIDMSMIAVDGTKIQANASIERSYTPEVLARLLTEAAETIDAEQDQLEQSTPTQNPPDPGLGAPGHDRPARIRQALADLAREAAEKEEINRAKPGVTPQKPRTKANVTDPDSRIMKTKHNYIQGYNAQIVVVESQVVVGVDVFQSPADVTLLIPMINQVRRNIETVSGQDPGHLNVVADAGYYSGANATIANTTSWIPARAHFKQTRQAETHAGQQTRRVQAATRYNQGLINGAQAAIEAGTTRNHLYQIASRLRQQFHQEPNPLQTMALRMITSQGKALYRRRCSTVEPVFGHIKHNLGIRQLIRRGLHAARQELILITAAGNLKKAWQTA